MPGKHARLSPSSADRWTTCTASPAAQDGIPNENSEASRIGTVCHQIQEECLLDPMLAPADYLGRTMVFWLHPESDSSGCDWENTAEAMFTGEPLLEVEAEVVVTDDMVSAVEAAVAFIREQHQLLGGRMLVEQRVPIGQFTGEDDAFGSADVILIGDDWLHVFDSKFGRKRVHASRLIQPRGIDIITGVVQPEKRGPNLQMACYALGAVHAHDVFGEITRVGMTIVQPYLSHTDSYGCSIEELRETERYLAAKARETETDPKFCPSYDACLFCRRRGRCDAQSAKALDAVFEIEGTVATVRPPNPKTLGSQYALVAFVEQWASDIQAATLAALQAGEPVLRDDGLAYKLVEGKNGRRRWRDAAEAEAALRKARLRHEQMFSYSLISPTDAEKLAAVKKPKKGQPPPPPPLLGKTQWKRLQQLITQDKGRPQIALETDPRPAVCATDGFEEVGDDIAEQC